MKTTIAYVSTACEKRHAKSCAPFDIESRTTFITDSHRYIGLIRTLPNSEHGVTIKLGQLLTLHLFPAAKTEVMRQQMLAHQQH